MVLFLHNVVTVTTRTEHNLNVGTPIQIKGVVEGTVTNIPYNTSSFVQEVLSSTSFTYLAKGSFTNVLLQSGGSLSVALRLLLLKLILFLVLLHISLTVLFVQFMV